MRNSPLSVTFGDGPAVNLTSPTLNGDNLILNGTSLSFFGGATVLFDDGVTNTLNSIMVVGTAQTTAYGLIDIYPPSNGNVTVTNGITLSHGSLGLGSANGGTYTLNGWSIIANGSTLEASGGRYGADPFVLNGRMDVSSGATASFQWAPLQGNGTIDVDQGGTVDVARVVAGLHMDVDRGGTLVVGSSGSPAFGFLGTINEAPGGVVDVLSAPGAVSEVFHRSTGTLDLLNRTGANVAELKFAGASTLYATADGGGGMDITPAHHIGSLPAIFVH